MLSLGYIGGKLGIVTILMSRKTHGSALVRICVLPQYPQAIFPTSQLFNPTTNTWNRDFIASIMKTQDTSDICKLPLHSRIDSDTIIWNASPTGSYTVKSAYMIYLNISDQWTNHHVSGDWKLIWSLRVLMSKTASVRFYRSSKNRVSFQQGVVQFN